MNLKISYPETIDLTTCNILGHSPWGMAMCLVWHAVGTIEEWLKLVPFLLGDEQLILRGVAVF